MKENLYIDIIKSTLQSGYIGDDCAYLKDFGIVVTQDNLVEDIHFSGKYTTPYQLGYKSVIVNISDICASGADPKYLTIGLSLPDSIDENFIEQFYMGAKAASGKAKIVGGDITGSDKIYISITAIGGTKNRNISSRSYAKAGQKIVISGNHGSAGIGLKILSGQDFPQLTKEEKQYFINSHLMPEAQLEFSSKVSRVETNQYAMMDTSDGLADALVKIAESSNVMLDIDFEKIPFYAPIKNIPNYQDMVLYGGEDYGLIATVFDTQDFIVIGEVKNGNGVKINFKDNSKILTQADVNKQIFQHFKE